MRLQSNGQTQLVACQVVHGHRNEVHLESPEAAVAAHVLIIAAAEEASATNAAPATALLLVAANLPVVLAATA